MLKYKKSIVQKLTFYGNNDTTITVDYRGNCIYINRNVSMHERYGQLKNHVIHSIDLNSCIIDNDTIYIIDGEYMAAKQNPPLYNIPDKYPLAKYLDRIISIISLMHLDPEKEKFVTYYTTTGIASKWIEVSPDDMVRMMLDVLE